MSKATTAPERNDNAAIILIAHANPRASAITPAISGDIWNFHIGGYQICEKWLKDRKGQKLSIGEITHYQKIVVVVSDPIRLIREVDEIIDAYGGWPHAFVEAPKSEAEMLTSAQMPI